MPESTDKQKKAASIIHSHAVGASGVSALFAQIPLVNIPAVIGLLSNMFTRLIRNHNPEAEDAEEVAAAVGGLILGVGGGTIITQSIVGLVPGLGNVVGASMSFGLFEATGWGLYTVLEEGVDIRKLTPKEFRKYIKLGKEKKLDVNAAIKKMPPHDKVEYERLVEKLKDKDLSDEARADTRRQVEALLEPYL